MAGARRASAWGRPVRPSANHGRARMSNNKTRSALRAGLQQEDAAVAERLPEVAQGGAPAPEANASPARKPAAKRAAATKAKPVEARPAAAAAEKAEVAKAAPAKDGAAGAPAAKPARRRAAPKAAVPVIEAV